MCLFRQRKVANLAALILDEAAECHKLWGGLEGC
jgi:hypothetical protein